MIQFIISSLLVVVSARDLRSNNLEVDLGDLPLQNPDLFGGDMLGVEIEDRNVIREIRFRWDYYTFDAVKKIPYVITSSVAEYEDLILSAMEEYHNKTCLRFVPRYYHSNYFYMFAGNGCYSRVGMVGGAQEVSLGRGCMFRNTIIHELGHVIGFYHEQNRSDRDEYLTIYWENIQKGMEQQFFKLKHWQNLLLTPFDYDSIMLYDNTSFSKDGKSLTMVAKTGVPLKKVTEKTGLSESDVIRINKMYNCKL